jgi:hypothetical protein
LLPSRHAGLLLLLLLFCSDVFSPLLSINSPLLLVGSWRLRCVSRLFRRAGAGVREVRPAQGEGAPHHAESPGRCSPEHVTNPACVTCMSRCSTHMRSLYRQMISSRNAGASYWSLTGHT